MFLLHLDALLDLLLWCLWLLVFLCQPASKQKLLTAALKPPNYQGSLCSEEGRIPLPLFKLPVQSSQCELVRIIFCELRPGNLLWGLLIELLLGHQVYFFMLGPGSGNGMFKSFLIYIFLNTTMLKFSVFSAAIDIFGTDLNSRHLLISFWRCITSYSRFCNWRCSTSTLCFAWGEKKVVTVGLQTQPRK